MSEEFHPSGVSTPGQVKWEELKLCPLCSALNHVSNKECFVCRWHGKFDTDKHSIRAAYEESIHNYGGVDDEMDGECPHQAPPPVKPFPAGFITWLQRCWNWLRR